MDCWQQHQRPVVVVMSSSTPFKHRLGSSIPSPLHHRRRRRRRRRRWWIRRLHVPSGVASAVAAFNSHHIIHDNNNATNITIAAVNPSRPLK